MGLIHFKLKLFYWITMGVERSVWKFNYFKSEWNILNLFARTRIKNLVLSKFYSGIFTPKKTNWKARLLIKSFLKNCSVLMIVYYWGKSRNFNIVFKKNQQCIGLFGDLLLQCFLPKNIVSSGVSTPPFNILLLAFS